MVLTKYLAILLLSCTLLFGCDSSSKTNGGEGGLTITNTASTIDPDSGKVTESTITRTDVVVRQPENAKDPATLKVDIKPDGNVKVDMNTGNSFDVASIVEGFKLLQPVIWVGLGLIVLGAGVGVLTKGRQLKASIALAVIGGSIVAFGYLLGQFPITFLICGIIAAITFIGYLIYTVKGFTDRDIAVQETVLTVQGLKEKYLTEEQRLKEFRGKGGIVDMTQRNNTTRKIVNKVKAGLRNV